MDYEKELTQERLYLKTVDAEIERLLEVAGALRDSADAAAREFRSDVWNGAPRGVLDVDQYYILGQYNQYLADREQQLQDAGREIEKLKRAADQPYFARIDFAEGGGMPEPIYIGRQTVMNGQTGDLLVCDWRAPVCSMFYRHECGEAEYEAPEGEKIRGTLTLKRQYEIQSGQLVYFFDADLQIRDEFLRRLLSGNAAQKMRPIVETIQRDQDRIIRDHNSGLLMVQGCAGSGKTSVALHRIAWLLYEQMGQKYAARDIAFLSPNPVFSSYVSQVLPDLGEAAVTSFTLDEQLAGILGTIPFESRFEALDAACAADDAETSPPDPAVLARLLKEYEGMIEWRDVTYGGRLIFTRRELSTRFAAFLPRMALAEKLTRIREWIMQTVRKQMPQRHEALKSIVAAAFAQHRIDVTATARMLALYEADSVVRTVDGFCRFDAPGLYRRYLLDPAIQCRCGVSAPSKVTIEGRLRNRDAAAVCWLICRADPGRARRGIRHLVVDEVQDYTPTELSLLSMLFPTAALTLLGDTRQHVGDPLDAAFYEGASALFKRPNPRLIVLNQSFRCTREIFDFARRLRAPGSEQADVCFARSGEPPIVDCSPDLTAALHRAVKRFAESGFQSLAVLCKCRAPADLPDAEALRRLVGREKQVSVIPIHAAKGMEYDQVIVWDCTREAYHTSRDRSLLYIAATRALHSLTFLCGPEPSDLLREADHA